MDFVGSDLYTAPLQTTLRQFEEADNFGSLIRPDVTDVDGMLRILASKNVSGQLFISMTHQKVLQALRQADYLSPKYHVVIANPPYMGIRGLNNRLGALAKENYPRSKTDLFAMFIERNLELAQHSGFVAMITMQSWMFLSTFEKLRSYILAEDTVVSMAHLGARAFDSIDGEVVSTTAFILSKSNNPLYRGNYLRLIDGSSESEKEHAIRDAIKNANCGWLFRASADDFLKIPGSPTAYWLSEAEFQLFKDSPKIGDFVKPRQGMSTNDNQRFLRRWFEVNSGDAGYGCSSSEEAVLSRKKWFPYNKGGEFRRWSGNNEYLVNWKNDGEEIKHWLVNNPQDPNTTHWSRRIINTEFYFKEGLTWSFVSSSNFGIRYTSEGFLFDVGGSSMFPRQADIKPMLGYLCSKVAFNFLRAVNPTLNFQTGNVASLPWPQEKIEPFFPELNNAANKLIKLSKFDWDSFETSWDFTSQPLLNPDYRQSTLKATYQKLRTHWREMTLEMQRLEEENNRIFIEAYGLQDELTPDVPLTEITLTCNPHYRYGVEECEVGSEKWEEMESRLLQDTIKELVSYAVGCMFGRYSLDMPGLVLANQGETLADFVRKVCSEEWVVDSEGENNGDRSQLQRVNSLAEGDGTGGVGLSGDQAVSEGRTLRVNQSSQAISGFHSVQHSGRSSQKIDGGVSEFLVNCERFKSRDGNPNPACPALEVCNERYSTTNSQSVRGSEPTSERTDEQPEITTHCPLSTIHFLPDDDNVIPMLDGDWFTDDIAERFRKFLRVAFVEEHYEDNLRFVEQGLNIKGKRNYGIRDYFLGEFYTDHVKRYKKRPIYWLFSSTRGSFNALIYMHRYRPDTVSVVLNDYLREFRTKLTSHKNHLEAVSISASSSQGEKTKALKEIEKITKMIAEMEEYEREVLYPLATEQVEIDLDDGVKINYPKLGAALKKIVGLEAKE
jgi:type II restriction/modification system DNA methylase subunit YeeA